MSHEFLVLKRSRVITGDQELEVLQIKGNASSR